MPNLAFAAGNKVRFESPVCDALQSREREKMRAFEVEVGFVNTAQDYIGWFFLYPSEKETGIVPFRCGSSNPV